ncbi:MULTISPECIES: fumarate/nitrate reduction transcriptional regulator Fnr [Chromobacterium]|jgi:CRP/FNR family transcriptional regulator|uniref:Transcriptional regulator n=5 Tax=Chromobacterium TaxID=535 RepID=A0A1W0CYN0_9NEIS|nr:MULTISPECIES: fumarate/nitrate reduction transcriptional regulator Fnr [Chromobacterium]AXT47890.1 fumarate/nitrate reduction transcriptional regulator Fnr [Chromobacterium rhizoryzae]KMN30325.1 transcriptional regulator [Chromobacterium sp. LK1]KMN82626.1 transcriptional regulator [Chromobacterium sp. LK11]MBK0416447.1 fumarate/nitrate reduction transcriptional regulator Fnr [Chromobacterium haemolyticum]MBN3005879.1 fumarate/nitrate reduction transcriptional regulator Fnr [Chromobacterium
MSDQNHISLHNLKVSCSNCSLKELCLPVGLNREELTQLDAVIRQSRRLKRGEYLFRSGEGFRSLFAVRTGFFKTSVASQDGREQVTGFHMSGELMGLDGISANVHGCDAIALEDSEVCELPFSRMESLGREIPTLQHHFYRLMSREIVRDQNVMLLLGNMKAEERLAAFLLNLSQRLSTRGFAANDFILRMSREEIGSFLGLKLETVSRTLSKFQQQGWITVDHKHIQLVMVDELKALISGCAHANGH